MVPEEGIESSAALGEWKINIHCGNCGDQEPTISIIGIRDIADTGNGWALEFQYWFHTNTV
jgi:hypothetical protein